MQDITFTISGMTCGHCLNAVSRAVSGIDGIEVRSVRIGQAELRAANHSAANLAKAAIEDAGYKVEGVIDG